MIEINESSDQPIIVEPVGDATSIQVAANVEVTILETGHHMAIDLSIGENAHVQYIAISNGDSQTVRHAQLGQAATLDWRTAILGGKSNQEIVTHHLGTGASSTHHGIFLGHNRDRFTLNYWSEHIGEHTSGHIVVHGVLLDNAYADFKGNIKIAHTARDTDGSLTEAALLLGDKSRSDSVPQLEIDTNDVKAAHSSSITRIDDEQLFYLQSRGITKTDGQRMIVQGFLEGIIDEFKIVSVRDEINALIEQRVALL